MAIIGDLEDVQFLLHKLQNLLEDGKMEELFFKLGDLTASLDDLLEKDGLD